MRGLTDEGQGSRAGVRRAAKIGGYAVVLAFGLLGVGIADGPARAAEPTPTNTPESTSTPTVTPTPDTLAAVLGRSAGSDYVAKHFSLIFGAVVLNPFKFEKLPTPTNAMPMATATATAAMNMTPGAQQETTQATTPAVAMPTPQIKLNVGGTSVKAFLEGGFRYRWAWLDRYPITTAARIDALASPPASELGRVRLAQDALAAARKSKAANEALVRSIGDVIAADQLALKAKQEEQKTGAKDAARDQAVIALDGVIAKERLAQQEAQEAANRDEATIRAQLLVIGGVVDPAVAEARNSWRATQGRFAVFDPPSAFKISTDSACCWEQAIRGGSCSSPAASAALKPAPDPQCGCPEDRFTWLVPDDWTLRLGYVFNADDQLGAATLAGASTFYAELAPGWNLFRFGFPTAFPDDTPIRGAINLEPDLLLASDSDLLAVHTRALFGLAVAFGVPFDLLKPHEPAAERGADDPTAVPTPQPIIEFVTRIGGVYVDAPEYADATTRLVKVRNELPQFFDRWGYGMDAEMNIPIVAVPGYVVMRGSLNAGFNPSTWAIQVGYTIPFSSVLTGLGAQLTGK